MVWAIDADTIRFATKLAPRTHWAVVHSPRPAKGKEKRDPATGQTTESSLVSRTGIGIGIGIGRAPVPS